MKTLTDMFKPYIGTHEYNGIVATIQEWFYGYVYKGAWCATSMSYFANQLGILDQLGGKNENVYEMMIATEKAWKRTGRGNFMYSVQIPKGYKIKRGTVIFNLNSGTRMTATSSKHVTTADKDFAYNIAYGYDALGGNQSDEIRVTTYPQTRIYAIFEPDYSEETEKKPTIKRGYKDSEKGGHYCVELQTDLNELGYTDDNGNKLAIDGSCGARTEQAIINFQKANGLEVDGHCGQKTWARIDELMNAEPEPTGKLKGIMLKTIGLKEGQEIVLDAEYGDYWHVADTDFCVKADTFRGIK